MPFWKNRIKPYCQNVWIFAQLMNFNIGKPGETLSGDRKQHKGGIWPGHWSAARDFDIGRAIIGLGPKDAGKIAEYLFGKFIKKI